MTVQDLIDELTRLPSTSKMLSIIIGNDYVKDVILKDSMLSANPVVRLAIQRITDDSD